MRSVLGLIFLCLQTVVWAQPVDINSYVLEGGSVGKSSTLLSLGNRQGGVKWMQGTGVGQTQRSKGAYLFAGQSVGEVVVQLESGIVVSESIDMPLVSRLHLPENVTNDAAGSTQALGKASLAPDTKQIVEAIKGSLINKLGAPFVEYSKPGENGASNCSVVVWRAQNGPMSRGTSWRLTTYYANDETFLVGSAPHFCRLIISYTPDLDSVLFDPTVFLLRDYELFDRLSLVGLKMNENSPASAKVLGAEATVKVNTVLNRLQSMEINFTEAPKSSAIVLKKFDDPFLNAANTVITSRVRSFPAELSRRKINYDYKDYILYDPVTQRTYEYRDTFSFATTDIMLVWSPGRGRANYRLIGKSLQVLPPGLAVTKAIDPTVGTLASGDTYSASVQGQDFNLPVVSFADFQKNVIYDKLGYWIEIPMENQGDLPLCLPASMARILRYYGKQVNQFSVAQVGGVGMRGTDWKALITILYKCSDKFGLRHKIYNPKDNFGAFVKTNIDNGIPVLWLIPGHARIINGYNLQTKSILYTDSWGAGFEVRSMPYLDAAALTESALVFIPPSAIK